jgi:hypothetical protein
MSTRFNAIDTQVLTATSVQASSMSLAQYTYTTRPSGVGAGTMIYNSSIAGVEVFDGTVWRSVSSGAAGSIRFQKNVGPFTLVSGTSYPLCNPSTITDIAPVVELQRASIFNANGSLVYGANSTSVEGNAVTVIGYIILSNGTASAKTFNMVIDFCTINQSTGAHQANLGVGEVQYCTFPATAGASITIPFILQGNLTGAGAGSAYTLSVRSDTADIQLFNSASMAEYAVFLG